MSEFKERMMMCSEDYDEMIDMALAMKDKEWFEELVTKQIQYSIVVQGILLTW
ncbi:IDEAL domain-containing protein [Brevibacillus halotolerans]|uniref:IDEAL domain-containing protein n=1 Tax=Brevibacillus halotolerans TaxID=1507437 RepID=UPI0015EE4415|nr:IDEAL domain-containing protein [Brevibacillus halotolerans]MBA4531304.1 IDEAL domain-containing protein [Brevibacillus halotolerans]